MTDRWLLLFLRGVGGFTLFAFAAAVMPANWMVAIADELHVTMPADSPLAFYLARNLSLLYGYVGAALLVIATDLQRYRPLVHWAAWGTISFSLAQFVVDGQSGLPMWWTLGESGSTLLGGCLLMWIDRHTIA
ncbi:MAG: hypothetical protein AAF670_06630 [Planctomycetota bacterium]